MQMKIFLSLFLLVKIKEFNIDEHKASKEPSKKALKKSNKTQRKQVQR
jgi:hypothetical protein